MYDGNAMAWTSFIFGDDSTRALRAAQPLLEAVNTLEASVQALSDEALRARTGEFRVRIEAGTALNDLLPEAFAVVREAARRTLGQRHFDVQILGGVILHQGAIAEMRTGEGKTLVATLPAYLNALPGRGVHIVTVNDYLARRDAVWMGQIYDFLGLSVGVINHNGVSYRYDPTHTEADATRDATGSFHVAYEFLRPCTRAEAYQCDITYGTNSEFGFDYLRDNLVYDPARVTQKGRGQHAHFYAIVDEVDSILIDESRTPLIISAAVAESESLYGTFARIAQSLTPETDYTVDLKLKAIALTDAGIEKAERLLGIDNIYTEKGIKYVHHLETAVRAAALYERDREYVVRDGEVIIVDEFTGRLQPGRRWSEGLHQAIEAKEGVKIREETRTMATITYQNYFRLYEKLSGMTGTAVTSAEEFEKVYNLRTIIIPPNRPSARRDVADSVFQTERGKFRAIATTVKALHEKGQPVLIGTVSIDKNELLSAHLQQEGIPHKILNAKNHEEEGEIIAGAGRKGSVVIATNMAGRGVDIRLGGAMATPEEADAVRALGGLFVLGTERHEARRIDNQLRGRSGRQGDPGETHFYVSLEDSLMKVFASDRLKNMMGRFGIPEEEPIQSRFVSRAIESAQTRIEGLHFDSRKHLLEYDTVMNHQRETVYTRRDALLFGDSARIETWLHDAVAAAAEASEATMAMIAAKRQELGDDAFFQSVRRMALQVLDMLWVEHLEAMDYLRGSVRLRAYGQRDPLVEYRREGLRLFKELEFAISENVIKLLPTVGVAYKEAAPEPVREVHEDASLIGAANEAITDTSAPAAPKVGRNDPCPCGSGKKYKKCHGK